MAADKTSATPGATYRVVFTNSNGEFTDEFKLDKAASGIEPTDIRAVATAYKASGLGGAGDIYYGTFKTTETLFDEAE